MFTRGRIRLGTFGVLLVVTSAIAADLPPLDPPVQVEPPKAEPTEPTAPEPKPRASLADDRPVLAIPGVTVPSTKARQKRSVAVEPSPLLTVPPLEVPAGTSRPETPAARPASGSGTARDARPLTDRGALSEQPRATAPRGPGILGRFPSTIPGFPRDRREPIAEPEESIKVKPRDDPEADATLKRRIQREAAAAAGGRARSIEVVVEGRRVDIRATGVGFFRKRSVRKALEGLPSLKGLRATVDVVD